MGMQREISAFGRGLSRLAAMLHAVALRLRRWRRYRPERRYMRGRAAGA